MTREVLNHLRDLDSNIKDWKAYIEGMTPERFASDRKERHALLHCVLVSLQAAIDTGNHWVSELTSNRPESYRSIIELLEEEKAIPTNLAKDLKGLFSLRNVLIHRYQELDLEKLYTHLQTGSKPLEQFLKLAKNSIR